MRTELRVEGMHCAGCGGSIERALRRVDGVRDVRVDSTLKRALIEHDEAVEVSVLVRLLGEMGFKAQLRRTTA